MYTGSLIEQLMTAVERVEKMQVVRETADPDRLYLAERSKETIQYEPNLVGVA